MRASAEAAIARSLSAGAPIFVRAARTEPSLVAAVAVYGIPKMARDWAKLTAPHGLRIEISAVFTHKTPQVKFKSLVGGGSPCELADLLIVVDNDISGIRLASLVQAKMASSRGTVRINGVKNKGQLDLFQRWPIFDFAEEVYGLTAVDFHQGPDVFDSGVYGIIDRHWNAPPRSPTWKQVAPTAMPGSVGKAPSLGQFIVDMVFGRAGRDATRGSPAKGWVKTVEALMTVTYDKHFHERSLLGQVAVPRGNSTFAFLLQDEAVRITTSSDGGLPDDSFPQLVPVDSEPENSAVNLLHVVISEDK